MRARRKALKLTQEAAGDRIYMSASHWSRIERGTTDPGVRTMTRIATALETTPAKLLSGIGVSDPSLATSHLGERRPALVPCPAMPPLRLAPPGPSIVSCDCCLRELPPGAPMATLEVIGPVDRDEVRPIGDYCEPCWRGLSAAWDVIEGLGHPPNEKRPRP